MIIYGMRFPRRDGRLVAARTLSRISVRPQASPPDDYSAMKNVWGGGGYNS